MDQFRKRHGRRLDHEERKCVPSRHFLLLANAILRRKRTAREAHKSSADTQKLYGHKAKLHHAKRHSEKVQMKKTLKAHDERDVKQKADGAVKEGALPTYLLDREGQKVGLASCLLASMLN
jgi:ribosome biogenesis protein NSA2